jgi:ABC-type antimicrobial peptide transport system permease subunit
MAVTGLFALVSLTISRRTKEIGIRKVLGASVVSIGKLINREFVIMLVVASVLASVGGYFLVDMLLDSIWTYHVSLGLAPFLLTTLLIFVLAFLTVGGQVYRVATANPIDALRYE